MLQANGEPPEEERPPWHWVALGAAATFLVWLPLAALAESLVRRPVTSADARGEMGAGLWLLAAHALAFCTGAFAGGLLVGRLGGKAGRKEATLAGIAAGALAWLIALVQGAPGGALVWGLLLVIITSLGGFAGALGGRAGLRLRAPGAPPRK